MIDLVVLDIAGTTVEEHGLVYRALADTVTAAGGSADDVGRWMGADKYEAISSMLGRPGVDAEFADFHERLAKYYAETPPTPIPGVPEALAQLRGNGVKVALTTGFDRPVVDGLLDVLGWREGVLDAVVCVDDVPAGRPAPYMIFKAMELTGARDVRRVLTAGDTVRDLEAGTNAGAGFVVGVLSGSQTAAELGVAAHTHLLKSVAEIPALGPVSKSTFAIAGPEAAPGGTAGRPTYNTGMRAVRPHHQKPPHARLSSNGTSIQALVQGGGVA